MPMLKIDHVVSFSSEDATYPANNLLSSDPTKKWKCKSTGEKSAIVVLQLEKASIISGIDIGNENSAYVEVLVTRSGMGDEYKVLLVMSSLMSPLEARQGTIINRVRMFSKDQLSKPECEQKWDRIKIVCTQPFNRHVQYGLSFVTLYSSGSDAPSQTTQTIGKFAIRPASPDTYSAGNLFSRRKDEEKNEPSSLAAAIRKADHSSDPLPKPRTDVTETLKKKDGRDPLQAGYNSPKPRNNISLLYDDDEQKIIPSTSRAKEKETDKAPKRKKEQEETQSKPKKPRVSSNDGDKIRSEKKPKKPEATSPHASPGTSKKKKNSTNIRSSKKTKSKLTKPFNKLLEGVTIVISGIQNPDRADLRSKALSMGAKYSTDWNDRCTHLICAFPNTPKFNQVRGRGTIVTRKWVEECYRQRKRLPWRRYYLDRDDKDQSESEEEVCEEVTNEVDSGSDTDVDNKPDDGSDTEERVKRILQRDSKQSNNHSELESNKDEKESTQERDDESNGCNDAEEMADDIYNADTDHEDDYDIDIKVVEPKFEDFFLGKIFFVDTKYDKDMYIKLHKYITAYSGRVTDDISEHIDVYVTEDTKSQAEKELFIQPRFVVTPNWVWECHNQQRLIPFNDNIT